MYLLPAVDILDGKAVRLSKGDYNAVTTYNDDPVAQAQEFEQLGATWLHVVDLNGAKSGIPENAAIIEKILAKTLLKVEVGGGLRSLEACERLYQAGVTRMVLGTALVRDPEFAQAAIEKYGNSLAAGIDAKGGEVAVAGWIEGSGIAATELASRMANLGYKHLIYTDIARDGMQTGIEPEAYVRMAEAFRNPVIASGGVASVADIENLAAVAGSIEGIITGRAIYEGTLGVVEGVAKCNEVTLAWNVAQAAKDPVEWEAPVLAKRVIPCMDVKDGRVVKGVNFVNLRDAGDPIELAKRYDEQKADEVIFLDITATSDDRATTVELASQASEQLRLPYCVGGGFRTIADIRRMIAAGADKVSVNSAAVKDPSLITEAAAAFGSQAIICAIDAKQVPGNPNKWEVYTAGGRNNTGLDAVEWAAEACRRGAGEILLTSMDRDGSCDGFDCALTRAVARAVNIPVIASGGVGKIEHFAEGIIEGEADAVLAASVFHFGQLTVREVKEYMRAQGIPVRL